jgi:hypothetical protein
MEQSPPDREIERTPDVDIEPPPDPIEAPDEQRGEGIEEAFPSSDPPSFTQDPNVKEPELPSTGLPSEAPGG